MENPGENGSAHACSSMKLEDGASAPSHRLCRGAPKCEVTWRIGKRFASRSKFAFCTSGDDVDHWLEAELEVLFGTPDA